MKGGGKTRIVNGSGPKILDPDFWSLQFELAAHLTTRLDKTHPSDHDAAVFT